jgi:hypothetical protein
MVDEAFGFKSGFDIFFIIGLEKIATKQNYLR